MKPTAEELEALALYAKLNNEENKYVWLRSDEKGRYIEFAFKKGVPHDNRCLSWYDAPHPKAWARQAKNHEDATEESVEQAVKLGMMRLKKVNELYRLSQFSCDSQDKEGDEHCSPGCPKRRCLEEGWAHNWTYEEPIKCACWYLREIESVPKSVTISMEKALKLKNELLAN